MDCVPKTTKTMAKIRKIKLGIMFGGRSGEHEVSLASAASVISALDPSEYEIIAIGLTKSGKLANTSEVCRMLPSKVLNRVKLYDACESNSAEKQLPSIIAKKQKNSSSAGEIIFPLLHGPYGEDGAIQGVLEIAGLPYIGCGVLASAIGMDKDVMKRLFVHAGLPVAPYRVVFSSNLDKQLSSLKHSLSKEFGYPMFSKPANLGSSVGVCKIHSSKEFEKSLRHSTQFDSKIIIEKGIDGRELECAILGNRQPQASVVGEVISAHEFYDYDAKYRNPESRLEIPARITDKKAEQVKRLALEAFKTIEGSGLARVDFFLERNNGKIWINEINTMPGFTPISMYSKLWEASGISYTKLVHWLVRLATERHSERKGRKISAV